MSQIQSQSQSHPHQRGSSSAARLPDRGRGRAAPSTGPSSIAHAAALQAHFARDLGDLSLGMGVGMGMRMRMGHGANSMPKPKPKKRVTEEEYTASLDLAERWGLVKKPPRPPAPLTEAEWRAARDKALDRADHDHPCPICYDDFGVAPQVILSCSHVYHAACLKSFERYAFSEACPLCRQADYEKLAISDGEGVHKAKCAVLIQALVRGFLTRVRHADSMRHIVPRDPERRRNFYGKQLSNVSRRLITRLDEQQTDVDAILAESEDALRGLRLATSDLDEQMQLQVQNQSKNGREAALSAALGVSRCIDANAGDGVYIDLGSGGDDGMWREIGQVAEAREWQCESCPICLGILALETEKEKEKAKEASDGSGSGRGRGRGRGRARDKGQGKGMAWVPIGLNGGRTGPRREPGSKTQPKHEPKPEPEAEVGLGVGAGQGQGDSVVFNPSSPPRRDRKVTSVAVSDLVWSFADGVRLISREDADVIKEKAQVGFKLRQGKENGEEVVVAEEVMAGAAAGGFSPLPMKEQARRFRIGAALPAYSIGLKVNHGIAFACKNSGAGAGAEVEVEVEVEHECALSAVIRGDTVYLKQSELNLKLGSLGEKERAEILKEVGEEEEVEEGEEGEEDEEPDESESESDSDLDSDGEQKADEESDEEGEEGDETKGKDHAEAKAEAVEDEPQMDHLLLSLSKVLGRSIALRDIGVPEIGRQADWEKFSGGANVVGGVGAGAGAKADEEEDAGAAGRPASVIGGGDDSGDESDGGASTARSLPSTPTDAGVSGSGAAPASVLNVGPGSFVAVPLRLMSPMTLIEEYGAITSQEAADDMDGMFDSCNHDDVIGFIGVDTFNADDEGRELSEADVARIEQQCELLSLALAYTNEERIGLPPPPLSLGVDGDHFLHLSYLSEQRRYALLVTLLRLLVNRRSVGAMDGRTLMELKSYDHPPAVVQKAVIAALAILGHKKKELENWNLCRRLVGGPLIKALSQFDPGAVMKKSRFQMANALIRKISAKEVALHGSEAAEKLYEWVIGVLAVRKEAVAARAAEKEQRELNSVDHRSAGSRRSRSRSRSGSVSPTTT